MGARPKLIASVPLRDASRVAELEGIEADMIELRLDYLPSPREVSEDLLQVLLPFRKRLLLTLRDPLEGGHLPLSDEVKSSFLKAAHEMGFLYDVEVDFLKRRKDVPLGLVVSKHYLNELPSLHSLKEEFRPYGHYVRKLAVRTVNNYRSLLISFLEEFPGSAVIPLGADWRERLAFCMLGSSLLYVQVGEPTAPGQMHIKAARTLFAQLGWS